MNLKKDVENRNKYLLKVYEKARSIAPGSPMSIRFGLSTSKSYDFLTGKYVEDDSDAGFKIGEEIGLERDEIRNIAHALCDLGYLTSGLGLHFIILTREGIEYLESLEETPLMPQQTINHFSFGNDASAQIQVNTTNSTQQKSIMSAISNNEKVILQEAANFFENKIQGSHTIQAIDDFKLIQSRMRDFYPDENKTLFLEEIKKLIITDYENHIIKAHGGKRDTGCPNDEFSETLIFYIDQELQILPVVAHKKYETSEKSQRTGVFVSYSHADISFLADIKRHFKPFQNIEFWDDSKIQPGKKWKEEIEQGMKKAKVAILLLSTDFFGSDFINNQEVPAILKAAEKDGLTILTVILKPCPFEEYPNINQFQAMNPPSNTVLGMNELEKETLYLNLVRQTKRALEF